MVVTSEAVFTFSTPPVVLRFLRRYRLALLPLGPIMISELISFMASMSLNLKKKGVSITVAIKLNRYRPDFYGMPMW
jgi:hypothetical protein